MIESVWKAKGIAELKYCKVERAAEILQCKLEDIFHWAYTGKIQICIKVHDLPCKLLFPSLAYSQHHDLLMFLVKYMAAERPSEVIKEYHPDSYANSLVSVYPETVFDFHDENDVIKIAEILSEASGYPFRIDGLWVVDSSYFCEDYLFSEPPVLGKFVSNDFLMMAKMVDVLEMDMPSSSKDLFLTTSFSLKSPDHIDEEDFKAMVGVLDSPITLSVKNLYLTKGQIENIYQAGANGSWNIDSLDNDEKKVRITTKQSTFTVALMRKLGFSDNDLQGSITSLRNKIAREIPDAIVPDDDKSMIEWLKKGGVRR
ncbi:hypothetical protein ACTM6F_06120 [Citrobacter freundii]